MRDKNLLRIEQLLDKAAELSKALNFNEEYHVLRYRGENKYDHDGKRELEVTEVTIKRKRKANEYSVGIQRGGVSFVKGDTWASSKDFLVYSDVKSLCNEKLLKTIADEVEEVINKELKSAKNDRELELKNEIQNKIKLLRVLRKS